MKPGNYIISGGTETVLVLWQLDTGKQQFLPHLSATIQNVVVSPTGTSYAVQLSDNSVMVLSTAELKPTANVAGIQASVVQSRPQIESLVRRVKEPSWQTPVLQRTPAVVNLSEPSRLILAVGQMQEVRSANPFIVNNPFLQTFDLSSGRNVSRQALVQLVIE
jgi:NET1-associated nuclear protein 1 (U3 small nucleolar RNA-associated protein 17)